MRHFLLIGFLLVLLVSCNKPLSSPESVEFATLPHSENPVTAVPELAWQFAAGSMLSAPAQVVDDKVLVATSTAVIALNAITGDEVWRVTPPDGVWSRSLAVGDGIVLVGIPGYLLALDSGNGQELWRQTMTGEVLWSPLAGNPIYVGTAFVGPNIPPEPDKKAWGYALDPTTGDILWSIETDNYTLTTPTADSLTAVFGGSRLDDIEVEEGGHLRFYALDAQDGTVRWTTDVQDGFIKSLATDGSRLFYLAYTDMVYALDMADGQESWHYSTENWSPGFTFADGMLYLGSDNAVVHAVMGEEGTAVWQTALDGVFNSPRSQPTISGDYLYFQSNDNRLYSLNRHTGEIIWQTEPQPRSRVALTFGDGSLYLSGQDGTLYAYR